ncbi:MAG: hypothetical protein PVF15_10700 [Candidatus Bathyarchaeota archaeon]|jgi:hypothetical protein
MRADYGFYILALVCFVIAALVIFEAVPYLPELGTFEATALTVISAALGLIFAILGYALRPKPIISILETPKPESQPIPSSVLPPTEETAKPETKTKRKRTKRRRKKT